MKTIAIIACWAMTLCVMQSSWAQSTTGGRSGGSTASTGTGYLTEGKRPSTSNPQSMTIDDEGASRAYMYVPPSATNAKNRSASPDGTGNSTGSQSTSPSSAASHSIAGKKPKSKTSTHQR